MANKPNYRILTYVSDNGFDPVSGVQFPEESPRYRTPAEIYRLLKAGHTVEERNGFCSIPLTASFILEQFKEEIMEVPANSIKVEHEEKKSYKNIKDFKKEV